MDIASLSSNIVAVAGTSAAVGAGAWHLIRPFAQPYIDKGLNALPAYIAGRARDRFAADVAAGKIPPPVVRLVKAIGRAAIQWADAEIGTPASTDGQAKAIVMALARVPYIDKLVAADPADAAHDISVALDALKAQLAKDDINPDQTKTTP